MLSNSQTKQDEDLSAIKQQIDDFLKEVKSQIQSVSLEFINSQGGQDKALSALSKAISGVDKKVNNIDTKNKESAIKLNSELSCIKSELKHNKLLNIVVIVGIIVSIILQFVK